MNWRAKLPTEGPGSDVDDTTEPLTVAGRAMQHARRELTAASRLLAADGTQVALRSRVDDWLELTLGPATLVVRQLPDAILVERAGQPSKRWGIEGDFVKFVEELDAALEWLVDAR